MFFGFSSSMLHSVGRFLSVVFTMLRLKEPPNSGQAGAASALSTSAVTFSTTPVGRPVQETTAKIPHTIATVPTAAKPRRREGYFIVGVPFRIGEWKRLI